MSNALKQLENRIQILSEMLIVSQDERARLEGINTAQAKRIKKLEEDVEALLDRPC